MSEEQLDLPLEETPATHPHLFIEVHTPEIRTIDGNGAFFEVLTGKMLISYRRRMEADGDAEFVLEPPKTRPIPDATIKGESYTQFVSDTLNHRKDAQDAKIWVGPGSHPTPERRTSHPGPTDHGQRAHSLYEGEGEGWI